MRKLLFSTFLILLSFIFISSYHADTSANKCYLIKYYNNLSTRNIYNITTYNELKNIKKICTYNICTYNSNNFERLISEHEVNIINSVNNDEEKIKINLKGIKIDTIYFNDCIY